jgi:hypothetical protein
VDDDDYDNHHHRRCVGCNIYESIMNMLVVIIIGSSTSQQVMDGAALSGAVLRRPLWPELCPACRRPEELR